MIINNVHIICITVMELKDYPILLIYPDTVLAFEMTFKCLKPVLLINILTMSDIQHIDRDDFVINAIDDPVHAHPQRIAPFEGMLQSFSLKRILAQ